jgi:hypothetical protein
MGQNLRPGLDPRRLVRLMREAVTRCELDLTGFTVLTEAASGAYVVTPVIAALAGADVCAVAGGNAYASDDEIRELTVGLARLAGVADRVEIVPAKAPSIVGAADIITNSGQVRPIDADTVSCMKPSAVVPLMYESWEYRGADVDLEACRERGIVVAGTNERHPAVGVFSYLGQMAVLQLHEAGIPVRGSRILLLCDNDFAPFIVRDLETAGAIVTLSPRATAEVIPPDADAVVLALQPRTTAVFDAVDAELLAREAPGAVLVQYWGDADRQALAAAGVPVWPPRPPSAGHMGVLPSAVGPEPIVRLQSGGLKVGEVLARGLADASPDELALVQVL